MRFCRAETVDEALDLLGEWGDDGRLLAGGTDLMVQLRRGESTPAALIHIERIAALSKIAANGRTQIGPLSTHERLGADAQIAARHPALGEAARRIGGWQTQAVGTIGGNLCNASPAADLAPPLLIADAHVALARRDGGRRRLSLEDFFVDRRVTARQPDEMLVAIDLEPLPAGAAEAFVKLGRRGAMDVAIVGLALRLGWRADGAIVAARIAVCSLAATPRRVPAAEAVLIGARLDDATLESAGQALAAAVSPIDDARATASYRRRVLPGLLARAARQCEEIARA